MATALTMKAELGPLGAPGAFRRTRQGPPHGHQVGWGDVCVSAQCLPLPSRADVLFTSLWADPLPSGLTPSHDWLEVGGTSGAGVGGWDCGGAGMETSSSHGSGSRCQQPPPAPPSPRRPQMSCTTRTWALSCIPPPLPSVPSGGRTSGDPGGKAEEGERSGREKG